MISNGNLQFVNKLQAVPITFDSQHRFQFPKALVLRIYSILSSKYIFIDQCCKTLFDIFSFDSYNESVNKNFRAGKLKSLTCEA